jgi:hypothetical protein
VARSPKRHLVASLIEHESCISLTHSRCWDPSSRLKTNREEGAGFFQITRAYKSDGLSIRFDALAELKSKYRNELHELNWSNIYIRPDLQIRAGILKLKENYEIFIPYSASIEDALAFADAAYNGGVSGVNKERRACVLTKGCNPGKWFGNVELLCLKSKAALYGKRSACDINRHHVKDVLLIRATKYSIFFK